jgi:sulfatase maturation enzyme AslB (radical SAM superfamily)
MNNDRYYLDEKELFESLISKNYLPNIFGKEKNTEWKLGEGIELIIRPQCNQKCKYCYLT